MSQKKIPYISYDGTGKRSECIYLIHAPSKKLGVGWVYQHVNAFKNLKQGINFYTNGEGKFKITFKYDQNKKRRTWELSFVENEYYQHTIPFYIEEIKIY